MLVITLLLFDCKSTYKKNKTAANSFMKFIIKVVNFQIYIGHTYNQHQFSLVYKQQQNVFLKITMGSIKLSNLRLLYFD